MYVHLHSDSTRWGFPLSLSQSISQSLCTTKTSLASLPKKFTLHLFHLSVTFTCYLAQFWLTLHLLNFILRIRQKHGTCFPTSEPQWLSLAIACSCTHQLASFQYTPLFSCAHALNTLKCSALAASWVFGPCKQDTESALQKTTELICESVLLISDLFS